MVVVTCSKQSWNGFFFCCDHERLFLLCFSKLSLVASLLVPSAFPFCPAGSRGRRRKVEQPHLLVTFRWFVGCDFFLFEAPCGPLICMFFAVANIRAILVIYCIFVPRINISCPICLIPSTSVLGAARNLRLLQRQVP